MKRWLLVSWMSMLLCGCIVVPVGEKPPFREEVVDEIPVDKVSRADVLMLLGAPDWVHEGESVLVYQDHQVHAVWLAILGGYYAAGIIGSSIDTLHLLVLEFDDTNRLRRAEPLRAGTSFLSSFSDSKVQGTRSSKPVCTSWGLCLSDQGRSVSYQAIEPEDAGIPQ